MNSSSYLIRFFRPVVLFLFLSIIAPQAKAQILEPVKWEFSLKELGNNEYELVFTANIEKHWHLYTQTEVEDGPLPTRFTFDENKGVKFIGKVRESKSIRSYEAVFGDTIEYFEKKAVFTQKVKADPGKVKAISGFLEFMVCDDKMCLPPEQVDFEFTLPAAAAVNKVTAAGGPVDGTEEPTDVPGEVEEILDPVKWNFKAKTLDNGNVAVELTAKIEEGWHLYARVLESDEGPLATEITFDENPALEKVGEIVDRGKQLNSYDPNFMMNLSYFEKEVTFVQEFKLKKGVNKITGNVYFMACNDVRCITPEQIDFDLEVEASAGGLVDEASDKADISFWAIFIKGFLGGLLALLTPCVFPMIPLTVSFFTKQSKTKAKGVSNAILYGVSIILIYVLLGYGVTAIFGADALNALSTNVWFNIGFFVLLVVFAISFFGAFEITLPSSWVNKADSAADKGGIIGIFFMAFTLSLVSFSCTGPIIGTLLVDAAVNGGVMGPLIGMFGFSFALAMPFGLFAAFPGWLNSLPSSGGWLNSVKVVLGFLELAFAFKFLSNADLVVQAGLLKRELFIAIWIAIFGLLTAYLLGLFQLPHDSKSDRISVPRLMFAVVSLMFTIYLIPGIWGAPLQMISGFPPPMFYSESPNGLGGTQIVSVSSNGEEVVGEPEHCPHHLNCFHDYDEGLAYAKEVGKPVMLDFTGWACVNCRKMEEQVWSDPSVLEILRDEVVLISLYVDEKKELPEAEQKEVLIGNKTKKIRTVGNKWSYLQAVRYNTNSQPYYVIIDHNEQTMNGSAAYDPDVEKFRHWLRQGIERFQNNLAQQ